jgi:hypothetical protein
MFGPQDSSDFSVSVYPQYIGVIQGEGSGQDFVDVYVEDLHPIIRPYRFGIYLRALDVPTGFEAKFPAPSYPRLYPDRKYPMYFKWNTDIAGEFPIVIQGVGGDGRKRNTTLYLSIARTNDSMAHAWKMETNTYNETFIGE